MNIKDLKPAEYNPRKITDAQLDRLGKAMSEFGDLSGIVFNVRTGNLIGGHQRIKHFDSSWPVIKNATEDSVGTVATGHIESPTGRWSYREVDWDEIKEKAANVAANKHGGDFDIPLLEDLMVTLKDAGYDTELTGFDIDELAGLVGNGGGLTDDDAVPEPPEEPITQLGDLWLLGDHRLLCGDSTDIVQVERLMDGKNVDMVFTDPPYGIGYNAQKSKLPNSQVFKDIIGDDFLIDIRNLLKMDCFVISFGANNYPEQLPHRGRWLCWDKRCGENADKMLGSAFELAWTNRQSGFDKMFRVQHGGAINADAENKHGKRLHPTQKPVILIEKIFNEFEKYELIFDPFLGSGSILIACEKTNRKCYGMELDPIYCDVIVKRWEEYTGKKARLEDGETRTSTTTDS